MFFLYAITLYDYKPNSNILFFFFSIGHFWNYPIIWYNFGFKFLQGKANSVCSISMLYVKCNNNRNPFLKSWTVITQIPKYSFFVGMSNICLLCHTFQRSFTSYLIFNISIGSDNTVWSLEIKQPIERSSDLPKILWPANGSKSHFLHPVLPLSCSFAPITAIIFKNFNWKLILNDMLGNFKFGGQSIFCSCQTSDTSRR